MFVSRDDNSYHLWQFYRLYRSYSVLTVLDLLWLTSNSSSKIQLCLSICLIKTFLYTVISSWSPSPPFFSPLSLSSVYSCIIITLHLWLSEAKRSPLSSSSSLHLSISFSLTLPNERDRQTRTLTHAAHFSYTFYIYFLFFSLFWELGLLAAPLPCPPFLFEMNMSKNADINVSKRHLQFWDLHNIWR